MAPVTVTGARPSDDFAPPAPGLNRLGGDVHDIPQSVIDHQQALMQSQGATSLQSAVRNVPGVTIGAAEGGTIGNNINLNGFSARTDLYLDGMRDRGQYYRDTFALEQIEVLMGPSSMLFGRGSTGGVINQVLKKPSLKKCDRAQRLRHDQRPSVRTTADVNVPTGEASAARVNLMFQDGKRLDARPDGRARFRHRAVLQVRHRHADRGHAVRACCSTTTTRSTTACRR